LAITDGFNSGGAETCNFGTSTVMGYDDLGRLHSANCGSPWSQSFSYDQFSNITKTGSISWACTVCYNGNNQYNGTLSASISYDADGNLLNDTFHTYRWDSFARLLTIDSTTCGDNGTCLTYDALGHMVEKSVNSVYTEVLYSPVGKTAIMSGQTTSSAYFPLPAGETLHETGSTGSTQYFWHKDWLGSVRFASTVGGRASFFDRAFAPFGETYSNFGNTSGNNFTGDTQDTISGTYDTLFRELNPTQGRWISPDPAGLGAVDPRNPQTWNRYAYVGNNPLSFIDPLGLKRPPCGMLIMRACEGNDPVGDNSSASGLFNELVLFAGLGPVCIYGDCDPGTIDGGDDVFLLIGPPDTANAANKVTCNSALPNGQTVGDVVRQQRALLENVTNDAVATADMGTPSNPLGEITGAFYPIVEGNGPIDFKNNFRGSGNAAFLGQAGNFAYYAIGSGLLPNWELDAGAGAYALYSAVFGQKPFSSLTGPMFSDASAASVRNAGLAANGCAQ
jgi:RHS repeat-associated protein